VRNRWLTLTAEARDDDRVVAVRWTVIRRPPGSESQPIPAEAVMTSYLPDRAGDYVLELSARDGDGLEGRCQIHFTAVFEPPVLSCAAVETRPLRDTALTAVATDNGMIVAWQWLLLAAPAGSAARPALPANGPMFSFRPDLAGEYIFLVTATDDEDLSASCSVVVRATAEEGLRVEMFWNSDATDLDIHLLSPAATSWFGQANEQDCNFVTCLNESPRWGNPDRTDDDPHLDLDAKDGYGPENINIDRPAPGVYRVGVHAVNGEASQVTVRLYCGGSRFEPRATLGPAALAEGQFWRVADVEVTADGRCEVRPLAGASGGADINSRPDAESRR
jgi:hypothetical protein